MSSGQDNFAGGFLFGAIVGGVIGGVVGALLASPRSEDFSGEELSGDQRKPLKASAESKIELARRGLEDKIAQLNTAIDDVRQQLSNVNGTGTDEDDRVYSDDV